MKRTRANAVTLLNWRGVFYGHYELDPNVTALEGANGAGKTTVMIAAYVVLLPDMGRLRFTNVGEHGASGGDKGIWGRLGGGGPSYALLDFSLPTRERLVAGVSLERRSEPSVEAIPFVISDLPMTFACRRCFSTGARWTQSSPFHDYENWWPAKEPSYRSSAPPKTTSRSSSSVGFCPCAWPPTRSARSSTRCFERA
jgi:hypothetical protein